jgi:hypothetical protein
MILKKSGFIEKYLPNPPPFLFLQSHTFSKVNQKNLHNAGSVLPKLLQSEVTTEKEIDSHHLQVDQARQCPEETLLETRIAYCARCEGG